MSPLLKTQIAQEIIRTEVAKHGEVTKEALRAYVENRISYDTFKVNVKRGMAQFERLKVK